MVGPPQQAQKEWSELNSGAAPSEEWWLVSAELIIHIFNLNLYNIRHIISAYLERA